MPSSPTSVEPFTVTLAAGTYVAEWYNVDSGETVGAGTIEVERAGSIGFTPPFGTGPAVLYLQQVGGE